MKEPLLVRVFSKTGLWALLLIATALWTVSELYFAGSLVARHRFGVWLGMAGMALSVGIGFKSIDAIMFATAAAKGRKP